MVSRSLFLATVALLGPISDAMAQGTDPRILLDEMVLNSAVTRDCQTLSTSRTMHALGDTVVVRYGLADPSINDGGKALQAAIAASQCLGNAGVATELRDEGGFTIAGVAVAHIVILSSGPTQAVVQFKLPRDFSLLNDDRIFNVNDARVGLWAAQEFASRIGKADKLVEVVN